MKQPLAHPTVEAVKAIHAAVLNAHGGAAGLRDATLLESAVAAPQATMMGEPLLTDPVEIAAAYLFYLCRNHPFVDGNKRTALATCLVFLSENGLLPDEELDPDAWEQLTLEVAASQLDRAQTAVRLGKLRRSRRTVSPSIRRARSSTGSRRAGRFAPHTRARNGNSIASIDSGAGGAADRGERTR